MIKCDIAIVDSGVDLSIAPLAQGVCLEKNNYGYTFNPKLSDEVGHGTIMYSIIKNQAESANIYVIKLPTQSEDESSIIEALKFIRANISCKLVNISLGVKTGDNLNELYTHCKEITESGTIIVSAFDNEGCHSFPAAFDCVIGVDSKNNLGGKTIFEYVENSPINILAMGSIQKIKMPNNKVLLCGGSSVAGAYITSFLYNNLSTWNSLNDVLDFLKEKSRCVFRSHHHPSTSNKILFNIENAAVFPFSKETQAFLRFSDHLSFHIDDYYDVRNSGKVGRKLRDYCELTESKKTIKDIDKIDFRNIDTIIMGHLEELNALLKRDFRKELLAKAIENNVNVYSFDSLNYTNLLSNTRISVFHPEVSSNDVPQNTMGKLYKIPTPVVGIFGTSSSQGKFSLQISVKKELEHRGYSVGTIGTEPHSLLFGFDVVFPMGYNSSVNLNFGETITFLNNKIHKMSMQGKEIIVVASQAQTIPYYCNNLLEFPQMQHSFALGTKPDAVVLCVNYHDEIQYIKNTIFMLTGLTGASVIAIVMYPLTYSNNWSDIYGKPTHLITDIEFETKALYWQSELHIPVFQLGKTHTTQEICQRIIDFF